MKGKVVLMAYMAAIVCWLCGCHVNSAVKPEQGVSVTVIPHGTTNTILAISGKGFSRKAGENAVTVGDKDAAIVSATPHRLIVKIPGYLQGRVPVTVKVKEQTSNVAYLEYAVVGALAEALRP